MGAGRNTETFNPATQNKSISQYGDHSVAARYLSEDQLGGVIFGCKHNTINECLSKQLFGLPSGHFAYVKNIKPGMPLFLFNYSDRKMHGIFEAACAGQLNIDQFAWSDDGRIRTQFPAQVRISTRTHCVPVPESQFKSVISGNYHKVRHFYFELDHLQTRALLSLFKPAPVHDVPNKSNPSWSLQPPTVKSHLLPGRVKSESNQKDFNQFVDDVATEEGAKYYNDGTNIAHEEQSEAAVIRQKLQELFVSQQKVAQSSENTVDSTSNKSTLKEAQTGTSLQTNLSDSTPKIDTPIINLTLSGQSYGNAELLHIIDKLSRRTEAMEKKLVESDNEILLLRKSVKDTQRRVQQLEYQMEKLQSNSSVPFLGGPHDDIGGPHIYLIGGFRDTVCSSSLETFCPTTDRLMPLRSMSSVRAYAAVAASKDHIYVFGGGDGSSWYHTVECYIRGENKWKTCPRLKHGKGSLAGATLNDKIYAIGGGDGSAVFSEVEMLDPAIGKWIDSLSMRQCRFAPAAAKFNGALYVIGGFDGNMYLQSAERYDPREGFWTLLPSMTAKRGAHSVAVLGESLYAVGGYDGNNFNSTVEIYDLRANSWRMGSPFSAARGYACAATMNDNLYLIGGLDNASETIETVEVYNERQGWSISGCEAIGRRAFACAIVI